MRGAKINCYIVMPYGKKYGIDFDAVFSTLIKPACDRLNFECRRCDKVLKSGPIHKEMIKDLINDEIVIVDLSTLNPNVFYELGIRHATNRSTTILIAASDTEIPFNLLGHRVLLYDPHNLEALKEKQNELRAFIANSHANHDTSDNLVHDCIAECNSPIPSASSKIRSWRLPNNNCVISIASGQIQNAINMADIWVNLENNMMIMDHPHQRSVSAMIRYYGAKTSAEGQIVDDLIADELRAYLRKTKQLSVAGGSIVLTSSGMLERTHGVKKLFHVAWLQGHPYYGFRMAEDIGTCIRNILKKSERIDINQNPSILIPFRLPEDNSIKIDCLVSQFVETTIDYLSARPRNISNVIFLAQTSNELATLRHALEGSDLYPAVYTDRIKTLGTHAGIPSQMDDQIEAISLGTS